jgi:hypothetical protein
MVCRSTAPRRSAFAPRHAATWVAPNPNAVAAVLIAFLITALAIVTTARAQVATTTAAAAPRLLVFRNIPSWDRTPDFEDALRFLKLPFDVKESSAMKKVQLSDYRVVVIPGAQWQTPFYGDFAGAAEAFDRYVKAGGVLVLELNGAERDGITLPGGASMVRHDGYNNLILLPQHPAVAPFAPQRHISADLASHGYLADVPAHALVLVTVTKDSDRTADPGKPTYVDYSHGKGRIIAACQCFHDQDESGRAALMPAVLSYAMAGKWYSPN